MEIRTATSDDCKQLAELRVEMRNERENPVTDEQQKQLYDNTFHCFLQSIDNGSFIACIAVDNEKIVATSGLTLYTVPPTYKNINGKVAYLMNMFTVSAYRKQGIGALLLQNIMEQAKAHGCSEVLLNASEMGRPLYQKYGFKDLDGEMVYYIPHE